MTTNSVVAANGLLRRPRAMSDVHCPKCWEPVHHGLNGWVHTRTHLPATWKACECRPECDWPSCETPARMDHAIGEYQCDGFTRRYRANHFLCPAHWDAFHKMHLTVEHLA